MALRAHFIIGKTAHARALIFAMALLSGPTLRAQLSNFSLTVTTTPETCLGNGVLHFAVSGTQPGAVITYSVYQLPDTTNPIAVQTNPDLGGRTAGDYLVIATQSLGGNSGTQQQTATIQNQTVPLDYDIGSTPSTCNDGTMTVSVTSGNAVQYEIISGPQIRPLQNTPLFTGLPAGVYEVRVFDDCGTGWVVTHTVVQASAGLQINNPGLSPDALPDCGHIGFSAYLAPLAGAGISYPLSVTFTVHAPGGSPVTSIQQTIASGPTGGVTAGTDIPMYYDQDYYCGISVTDGCGNTYTLDNILVHPLLSVGIAGEPARCGNRYLIVQPSMYGTPYQIDFTAFPAGFDPVASNPQHPGPFNGNSVSYGDFDNPVPWGTYHVRLDDGCGHTAESEVTLIYEPVEPFDEITPYAGCQSNQSVVKIKLPEFEIVTATLTAAPAAYGPVPDDVSDLITTEDGVLMDPLITGNYHIQLIDECGKVYEYDFFVPDTATTISKLARPGCDEGTGSLRIRGNSVDMDSIIMTGAPAGISVALPHDYTAMIGSSGNFSLGGIPSGTYTFDILDSCGLQHTETVSVPGYSVTSTTQNLTRHCGSFDLELTHVSTTGGQDSFWLQKWDAALGQWVHPGTGAVYMAGALPSATNSYPLQNNTNNLSLTFTGHFRILKSYQAFGDSPSAETVNCLTPLYEFDYTGSFQITGFEKLTCGGSAADVRVLTDGVPPITYKILNKNGAPFLIDNATDDVFTGLEPAVYDFQAKDACNNIATGQTDVGQLPSIAQAHQPADLVLCDDASGDGVETFDLSQAADGILGGLDPSQYAITYHATQADAENGANPLSLSYPSGNALVYARLLYLGNNACYDTASFHLIVHPYPVPNMSALWSLCEGNAVTVTAPAGFDSYLWSTGQQGTHVVITQPGNYSLTVTHGGCTGIFPFAVDESNVATIDGFGIRDWTDHDNSITVNLASSSIGQYEYSLDNVHWQDSPVFEGLPVGDFTVFVRDLGGCGTVTGEVFLLNYPKFFTPNGDGYNDYWRVKYSEREPHMMTYVFDRYGKLITGFLPDSPGWDGRYNGEPLPSTDYWFLVIREDGRQLRGHFSMKR